MAVSRPEMKACALAVPVWKLASGQEQAASVPPYGLATERVTIVDAGSHVYDPPCAVIVTGLPLSGSLDVIRPSRPVMGGRPSASTAHIAYTGGGPSRLTRWAVGVPENGYATLTVPLSVCTRSREASSSAAGPPVPSSRAACRSHRRVGAWPVARNRRRTAGADRGPARTGAQRHRRSRRARRESW